jgi:hypothetical protein
MEYQLRERGWGSHEDMIRRVLWGNYAPENRAHQIQPGHCLQFRNTLRQNSISLELVDAIVTNQHPLALLLFGSLDLDNLDNVARMAFLLGVANTARVATEVARALEITRDFRMVLPQTAKHLVGEWSRLRQYSYESMLFDGPTMATQAVLYSAISVALDSGIIREDDWFLNDEQLIEELRRDHRTKNAINLEYLGTPPAMAFCIQARGQLRDFGFEKRDDVRHLIENVLKGELQSGSVLGYVVIDSGTFEKALTFLAPAGNEWCFGQKSESVIFYGFAVNSSISQRRCNSAALQLLEELKLPKSSVLRFLIGPVAVPGVDDAQRPLDFETSERRLGLRG